MEQAFTVILHETNLYLQQDPRAQDRPSKLAMQDVKIKELHSFVTPIISMEHDQRHGITNYRSRNEQTMPFFSQTMEYFCFLNMLEYLHFADKGLITIL